MIKALIHWIEGTAASQVIQTVFWIIPTVQIAHILCVSIVISSMAMLDFRLLGLALNRHSIPVLAHRFMPWLCGALCVLLLSGLVLIIGEPGRSLGNWVFQLKMGLLLLAVLASLSFTYKLKHDAGFWERTTRRHALSRLFGLLSLILWVGIVVCGRWIAYV